jgi:hypothetical protein
MSYTILGIDSNKTSKLCSTNANAKILALGMLCVPGFDEENRATALVMQVLEVLRFHI